MILVFCFHKLNYNKLQFKIKIQKIQINIYLCISVLLARAKILTKGMHGFSFLKKTYFFSLNIWNTYFSLLPLIYQNTKKL